MLKQTLSNGDARRIAGFPAAWSFRSVNRTGDRDFPALIRSAPCQIAPKVQ
jgi:hypothetical protein